MKSVRLFTLFVIALSMATFASSQTKDASHTALATAAAKQEKADAAETKKLEKAYGDAKAAYKKSPKKADTKKKYVDATNALAFQVMNSSALGPREKYPRSLQLYRETLSVDPKNADATKWKNQLEAIYKSMGRPIPK